MPRRPQARYKADLQWLVPIAAMLNASVTVYCKSPNASATAYPCAQELPNVGNEGHTYLWHITRNYHQLARLTVFLPDTATYGDKLKTWRRFRARGSRRRRESECAPRRGGAVAARY